MLPPGNKSKVPLNWKYGYIVECKEIGQVLCCILVSVAEWGVSTQFIGNTGTGMWARWKQGVTDTPKPKQ